MVVRADRAVAVVDGHRGDQLVVRVRERGECGVPVLADLVVEVVEDEFLAGSQDVFGGKGEAGHLRPSGE
ncbi:hypothetical protein JCM4814A_84600 [Streptomyces phaeofaciens JCM 4814]